MGVYNIGDGVVLDWTFTINDTPADPTTVKFRVTAPDKTVTDYVFGVSLLVTNPSVGEYVLTLPEQDVPGLFRYRVIGTGAAAASSPEQTFIVLPQEDPVTDSPALRGPCTPWVSSSAVAECCGIAQADAAILGDSVLAASQVLYALVPKFTGMCGPIRVRPCGEPCSTVWLAPMGDPWSWSGNAWWWLPSQMVPSFGTGETRPVYRGCGCAPLSRVLLAGRVRSIIEVTIDGATVDPATYRLDDKQWLTRTPDPADPDTRLFWPSCQDMAQPETETGTFSVLYTYGVDAPVAGRLAAQELACAIHKVKCGDLSPDECPLPNNVTRVVRQGITVDLMAFTGWGFDPMKKQWMTGMPLVDMFLNAYNPTGRRRRRSRVWSPDMVRSAQKLGA